jgi:hypothetical protein
MEQRKSKNRTPEWIIKNNGDIVYPYEEAERKGIARREFRNALDELIAKGFLDITHQGSGGRSGDMTKYLIDSRWKNYGTDKFKTAKNPRKKDSRKGTGWAAYHEKKKQNKVTKLTPKKPDPNNRFVTPRANAEILSVNKIATSTSQ